jgi:hypothetical protein
MMPDAPAQKDIPAFLPFGENGVPHVFDRKGQAPFFCGFGEKLFFCSESGK